jgi:hypothetical protein
MRDRDSLSTYHLSPFPSSSPGHQAPNLGENWVVYSRPAADHHLPNQPTFANWPGGFFGRNDAGEILVNGRSHVEFALQFNEYWLRSPALPADPALFPDAFYTRANWLHSHPHLRWQPDWAATKRDLASMGIDIIIILAVLGLIAISTLGNRYRLEELSHKLTQSNELFLDEFPARLKDDFEAGKEVWLVGVTLARTVKTYYVAMERKIRKGHIIKVLLVHPEGPPIEMAETRIYGRMDVQRTIGDIRNTLQDLCDLRAIAPDRLQIRTIKKPFGIRCYSNKS